MGNYFNWSKADVEHAIATAKAKGETSVALNMNHNDYNNEQQVVAWAKALGHEAVLEQETVTVTFKN